MQTSAVAGGLRAHLCENVASSRHFSADSIRWYVACAPQGSEEGLAARLRAVMDPTVLEDAFTISRQRWTRVAGTWQLRRVQMYPGYLFLASRHEAGLARALRELSFPVRLAGGHGLAASALEPQAQAWYAHALDASHTVCASEGVLEGGALRVTRGPLVGQQGRIVDFDRHKRTCYVRVSPADGGLVECFALDVADAPRGGGA